MSSAHTPRSERMLRFCIDIGERIFLLLLFATFLVALSKSIEIRPYNILVLIAEALTALLIIIRRPARAVTLRSQDWLIAFLGTALPMYVRAGGTPLLPPVIGTALMFSGLLLAIFAQATLRRSFGLVAANRGPVAAGPYRLIRHPMYAGYIIIFVGFFLNNPLLQNLVVYTVTIVLQVMRILAEEKVLRNDPAYGAYAGRVRYRLLPALF